MQPSASDPPRRPQCRGAPPAPPHARRALRTRAVLRCCRARPVPFAQSRLRASQWKRPTLRPRRRLEFRARWSPPSWSLRPRWIRRSYNTRRRFSRSPSPTWRPSSRSSLASALALTCRPCRMPLPRCLQRTLAPFGVTLRFRLPFNLPDRSRLCRVAMVQLAFLLRLMLSCFRLACRYGRETSSAGLARNSLARTPMDRRSSQSCARRGGSCEPTSPMRSGVR